MADPVDPGADKALSELRARAEALEQQLTAVQKDTEARLIRAEMKAEAVRHGMVDLDGLKLLDMGALKLGEHGAVEDAAGVMTRLKRDKPWLFGTASSSSTAAAPPAQPPTEKRATDMTDAEYRVARAALLKRRF
jgi:hypothetical protein